MQYDIVYIGQSGRSINKGLNDILQAKTQIKAR